METVFFENFKGKFTIKEWQLYIAWEFTPKCNQWYYFIKTKEICQYQWAWYGSTIISFCRTWIRLHFVIIYTKSRNDPKKSQNNLEWAKNWCKMCQKDPKLWHKTTQNELKWDPNCPKTNKMRPKLTENNRKRTNTS